MKFIIYQMLNRLWGNSGGGRVKGGSIEQNGTGTFASIDSETFAHIKSLGASYVWYTGIIRHATACRTRGCSPSDSSWVKGDAGSPYSIIDYFDVNPYMASDPDNRMAEFEDLVRRTHEAGLKVIIDFVPNHVARDYGRVSPGPIKDGRDANGHPVLGAEDDVTRHWLPENDFFYYPGEKLKLPVKSGYSEYPAKATGNCYSSAPGINDWYDSVKINYCDFHTGTWNKMYEAVRFWAQKGVDGFRCDMVELVPSAFLKWMIEQIKGEFPEVIFIGEIYNRSQYSNYVRKVGFDLMYDKSGLYDALRDIVRRNASADDGPVEEWQSTRRITGNWQYLGDLQPKVLNFLENHDEPRFPSPELAGNAEHCFSALYASLFFNTAPFMLYFGEEVGESGQDCEGMSGKNNRTTIFDWWKINSVSDLYESLHGRKRLDEKTYALLERYRRALSLAASEPAITEGVTYDLCYCNLTSRGFDKDRHFAFLRHKDDTTLLFVCNFAGKDADMDIYIPQHAFDWMALPQTCRFNPSVPVRVQVKAYDAVMLRLDPDHGSV